MCELSPLDESRFKGGKRLLDDDTFGVQVRGFDLASLADEGEGLEFVEQLLLKHAVVIFKDQTLNERQEVDVARRLPHDEIFRPPQIEVLGNTDRDGKPLQSFARPGELRSANPRDRLGEYWHVDGSQNAMPMIFATISAANRETARCGGSRTLFASGFKAFDLLQDDLKEKAEKLAVRYSKVGTYSKDQIILLCS